MRIIKLDKTIAFLGAGNMAEALISGIVQSKRFHRQRIIATDLRSDRCIHISRTYGIVTMERNRDAVKNADVVVLAVKPSQIEPLLADIAPSLKKNTLIISIAAGITIGCIERGVRGNPVIRTMPNIAAQVGAGVLAMAPGKKASAAHLKLAAVMFSSVAHVVTVPEKHLDAVTAISGSGPAYFFRIVEILEAAGVQMGLPPAIASELARGTLYGAGKMLHDLTTPAGTLRENVTSPAGTTAAALTYMDEHKLAEIVTQAVLRAQARARELSR